MMNRFSMSIDDSKTQANSWSRQETHVHQATHLPTRLASRLMEYSTKQIHPGFSPHEMGANSAWT